MTQATPDDVPEFDQADRMRKALRVADVGVQDMADYLGVSRNAVSTWINGRNRPSPQSIRLWAMRCGVPFEWLRDGRVTSQDDQQAGQPTAPYAQVIRLREHTHSYVRPLLASRRPLATVVCSRPTRPESEAA